ncbi:DUF7504 family protein [Natranaeroarchaeum sulfidigenes]|uniref:KaiC-like protein ATPase n=1 Tax=Natranaeroarchaeum sulfidigenes TaxID=2784880 RepID=A0A897MQ99_9EURY|nr:hypothetical protein [Natranaeroarchaeum sulfidigenes]QSG02602.1 KaiC-like protein ATPase [Natranaeroarchaeum sulfidigenes]
MQLGRGDGVPDSTTFSQELAELKQNGCNLLLVGDGSVHSSVCRHLLGDDRRRLFVFTEGKRVCACDPETLDGGDGRTVRVDDEERSLTEIGSEVVTEIDLLASRVDGLSPGELRLCFDSLGPLFVEHDPEQLFRLLHLVSASVRRSDGIGHYHLRVDRKSDHVNLIEPLFDVLVEVRRNDGIAEQRWHLLGKDVSSDWLPL